ncbi:MULTISPECIES: GntR family transcriptional regulator [Paenibacillus]|uniref:GntR family transcriptional regulator n=1 Tax=Paenibacillus TaxID=44249 RepID=UPI00096E9684|nr:GntR family transcriptional regulator [Paenibacillus odorifer]OMD15374.1 GntR family transcriptional regulator [Paenibacillus odorifer]OME27303.1 GntR family transcriptional regulator [Paenibacillus odorifer]
MTEEQKSGVSFNIREPVYIQVVRHFKEQIATEQIGAGDKIPSRRELASVMKINANTAQKAYKEMEEQGLIVTEGNSPSRITQDQQILNSIRAELIESAVDIFISSIQNIQIPVEELVDIIKTKYTSERKLSPEDGDTR